MAFRREGRKSSSSSSNSVCKTTSTCSSSSSSSSYYYYSYSSYAWLVAWYVLFGALHELSHVLVAAVLLHHGAGDSGKQNSYFLSSSSILSSLSITPNNSNNNNNWIPLLLRIALSRQISLDLEQNDSSSSSRDDIVFWVRHVGWVTSLLLAALVLAAYYGTYYYPKQQGHLLHCSKSSSNHQEHHHHHHHIRLMLTAAALTAVEAVATDLLGIPTIPFFLPTPAMHSSSYTATTFFCGNFGIILLHQAWLQNADGVIGKSAVDVLEKMILVTSMRGAQSGGVITFLQETTGWKRTRVVNRKRTSLSTMLRNKLQRRNTWFGASSSSSSSPSAASFSSSPSLPRTAVIAGHTRFATSSKATLEGTHPQQWTPPTKWKVWRQQTRSKGNNKSSSISNIHSSHSAVAVEPVVTVVENFITHNGDFEFYVHAGKTYDLHAMQTFISVVTGTITPAVVDSCAVAGMLDVLRSKGCFALSARYALCLGSSMNNAVATVTQQPGGFPNKSQLEAIGAVFDDVLREMLKQTGFEQIDRDDKIRESFARRVESRLEARREELIAPVGNFIDTRGSSSDPEDPAGEGNGATLLAFCMATIHAFFDNDLFMSMKIFLEHARGSFGLCFASSLDGHRQICLAARGQTMSVAFYPNTGLICYGSEQAAVKAGMTATFPGDVNVLGRSRGEIDNDGLRLDLDDLGGEIILLDWAVNSAPQTATSPVSRPNEHLPQYELMLGRVTAILYQQSKGTAVDAVLYHRMTRLTRNRFIRALQEEPDDLILADIQDIPKVCRTIQDDWHADKACISLNRLTAFHMSRCLRERLEARISGNVPDNAVDILLTGCEVSLWVAEQFASDLQKTFPRLRICAISSNKILGTYGQGISIPSLGFPFSRKTHNLHDAIVIIVSHSGGTFAPLACSSLLQSATKNLFVVTSEWDTQIGKQLRKMDTTAGDNDVGHMFKSRIFSTEVGMRPAEPCSVSVVATHQLLTNLFEYICVIVLSDARYRRATGALISEQDLLILEKCNRSNIDALADIVGMSAGGVAMESIKDRAEVNLRAAGNLWAEHILENARAYIMSFIYIFVTVTCGYPLLYGIANAAGLDSESHFIYLIRFFDAAIYFWLPQINVTIVRLVQGRNLLHRMVGRTVVIGDIPWVASSAEAFLSKIFAVSYSIAGLNVLSGNPVDHFVHRHTHRVTRGSLVLCGRPDGRLSALSTAEAAVCLSVNQASSIQSWGGTCESVTIGHNPSKLPLSANAIFLKRKRPLFLCERMLVETDVKDEARLDSLSETQHSTNSGAKPGFFGLFRFRQERNSDPLDFPSTHDPSIRPRVNKYRTAAALLGVYTSDEANTDTQRSDEDEEDRLIVDKIVEEAIREKKFSDRAHILFQTFDKCGRGTVNEDQFIDGAMKLTTGLTEDVLRTLFKLYDQDGESVIDYHEFLELMNDAGLRSGIQLPPSNRDERGIIRIQPSKEKYFGQNIRKHNEGKSGRDLDFSAARSQHFVQELYETRVASMQRFVAITVMSHQMGMRVEQFFRHISFGWLGYRMDRTHSIMRIATTASPVSGADVKEQMRHMQLLKRVQHSVHVISLAYLRYKAKQKAPVPNRNTVDTECDF